MASTRVLPSYMQWSANHKATRLKNAKTNKQEVITDKDLFFASRMSSNSLAFA